MKIVDFWINILIISFIFLVFYMMKKWLLVFVLPLFALALVGCDNNCECVCPESNCGDGVNENAALEKVTQECIDKWGTHSLIHSQTAVYGECSFPSWVTCDDDMLRSGECQPEADVSNIDTEEERIAGCEESVNSFVENIENGEVVDIKWEDEEEAGASFVRNWTVKYSKWWDNRKVSVECVADFVDGSITVSYNDEDTNTDEEPMTEWGAIAE